jgi:carbon monoxide dehydrogenase subunit G
MMEFDNSFEVPLPPDEAWAVLMDVPRIAPCMPGAELTEIVDEKTFKGKISVRLGPVSLAFAGTVMFEDIDVTGRTARVKAQGSDAKGRGGAHAVSTFQVQPAGAGSKVLVHTDLALSGAVAQYGRGIGMIQATAAQLMQQFADCLQAQLRQQQAVPGSGNTPSAAPPNHAPISALTVLAKVIWTAVVGWFGGRSRRS